MPLYEYKCEACGSRFEKIRQFSDPPLAVCVSCGQGPVTKLLSSPAIQFKGSGFYITDYAKKSSSESSSSESKKGESESKSDSKSEGKSDSTASSASTNASAASSDKSDKPAKKDS